MTRLMDIGEYGLHAWLREALPGTGPLGGLGDDCAFLDLLPDHYLLVSSDRLPLNLGGFYGGRLVVTQNFSDIVAKGGTPLAFLLDVYMPRDAPFDHFRDIVLGAKHEAARYGARIVGGDTKEDKGVTVVGVGVGTVPKPHRVTRSGVRPGDVLAVTLARGDLLGTRWAKIVADALAADLRQEVRTALADAYARDITLPAREMQAAVATGGVTAAIDNSDGLGGSLEILARESGVGFAIDSEGLLSTLDPLVGPVANALGTDPVRFAFAPGYDWQCLLSIAPDRVDDVRNAVAATGGAIVAVGEATAERAVVLREEGRTLGGVTLFSDEKFKTHPWEDQPRHWLAYPLLAAAEA